MTKTYSQSLLLLNLSLKAWLLITAFWAFPSFAALSGCSGEFLVDGKLKLKSFCTSYDNLEWSLDDPSVISTGGNFCLIAYDGSDTATRCTQRTMENAAISIDGTGNNADDSDFFLGGMIPIKIELEGAKTETFVPGKEIPLTPDENRCICGNTENQYNLKITVSKENILNSGITTHKAEGNFTLYGFNKEDSTRKSIDFTVTLTLQPAIQISGLEDMTLVDNNGSASGEQKFCVFAIGSSNFSLQAESSTTTFFTKKFRLKNNSEHLDYTMTITDKKGKNKEYSKNSSVQGWTPTGQYLCNHHSENDENMTLTIKVDNISGAAGVYSDTMTLTVTPN